MFLNNADHEDTINFEENPNYDEKPFENEFLSLHNFNFYLLLNFNFIKIENQNQNVNRLVGILDSNNNEIKENSDSKNFLELKDKQENNFNDFNNNKPKKEILNIIIKFNFNHKNNNGKIFLDFFESLNKNEKSVKWVNRKTAIISEQNLKSSSFIEEGKAEAGKPKFSLENYKNEYLNSLYNSEKEKNLSKIKQNFNKQRQYDVLEDPLDKDEYYIKNLDRNFSEATVKEKKLLFLKFLNSVIYDSCKEKKSEAIILKENLRKILEKNLNLTNKISLINKNIKNLEAKKASFAGLFEESEQMLSEKASIKSLELKQIHYYMNIISKIDKAFIRDSLLIKKTEENLNRKIKELDKEKLFYNKTENAQVEKHSFKENLEFDIQANKKRIIQMQSEMLDNKNILSMIENDKQAIENKIDFRRNKINKGKIAVALLHKKIEKLNLEKNQTQIAIQDNLAKKANIKADIDKDYSQISEIEKKIKKLLAEKSKILDTINKKSENLEKIENENFISGNKLVLVSSNLNYLESSLAEKQKTSENSNKNILQIKSELEKIKIKENIFTSHIKILNSSIANFALAEKDLQKQNDLISKELSGTEVVKALSNKRILAALDEINNMQIDLNKLNSNLIANFINKKNYQVNIKNTIDNLVNEKVLGENEKYYEYLENFEKESFKADYSKNTENNFSNDKNYKNEFANKIRNVKNKGNGKSELFDYFSYKRLKEKTFKELIYHENSKIKESSRHNDKIKVYKADGIYNINSSMNKTLDSIEDLSEDANYDLDIDRLTREKLDSKLIDDYIIIDYDKLFNKISKLLKKFYKSYFFFKYSPNNFKLNYKEITRKRNQI
jgi:hypothetical protein